MTPGENFPADNSRARAWPRGSVTGHDPVRGSADASDPYGRTQQPARAKERSANARRSPRFTRRQTAWRSSPVASSGEALRKRTNTTPGTHRDPRRQAGGSPTLRYRLVSAPSRP